MNQEPRTPGTTQDFRPQSTQIYRLIGDLMKILAPRYEHANKATRNLTMPCLWRVLAEMTGDYCMGFTCRNIEDKKFYFNRLRCNYYSTEGLLKCLKEEKILSDKHLANITITILEPLIRQINGLINKSYQAK